MSEHATNLYDIYKDMVDNLTWKEVTWHRGAINAIDNCLDNDKFDLFWLLSTYCKPDDYDGVYTPEQNCNYIYTVIKLSEKLGWETTTDYL